MNDLNGIIQQLEQQKEAIDRALAALQEVSGTETASSTGYARKGAKKGPKATKKRGLTAAGRKSLSDNLKKRWAAKRAAKQALAASAAQKQAAKDKARRKAGKKAASNQAAG